MNLRIENQDPTLPDLGEVFGFLGVIWRLDHALETRSKQMEKDLGVTGAQRFVLRIVGRFPGMLAGQLARVLHLHPSTVTGLLQRLAKRGLVRVRPDPRDRRRRLLGLTDRGHLLDVNDAKTVESVLRDIVSRFDKAKIDSAREVLAALADALSDNGEPPLPDDSPVKFGGRKH